jgi:uncharacterized cupin superfamily protein
MGRLRSVNMLANRFDERRSDKPGYAWRRLAVSEHLGGELLAVSLYELPPGEGTWPYHWHWANEELAIVLAGALHLRSATGDHRLVAGDAVLFERGPGGAHELRNDADEPARVLILSTTNHPEIAEYPDRDALFVIAGAAPSPNYTAPLELVFQRQAATDGTGTSNESM